MLGNLKKSTALKRIQKTMFYSRTRQYFPMKDAGIVDDRDLIDDAELVKIDWPTSVKKPRVGIIRDFGKYPRWTKYRRFLEKNSFPYEFFEIQTHDWIARAEKYDLFVGLLSNELSQLEEIRQKFYFIEKFLGKSCFPSMEDAFLYENKNLEAYISEPCGIPLAKTHISHCKADALALIENLHYPLVSKISSSSGSVGVELVKTPRQARKIIDQAFSKRGRKVHVQYYRQKDYIFFQEFIPNDGYDIRVILVGNRAFGYYRVVLKGDFRASGMLSWEKRALPEEAVRIAWEVNKRIRSPLLVIDMLHGLDGKYKIIEYSPICQMDSAEELHVNGIPGVYVIEQDGAIHFETGRYWVAELALREFLLHEYLPGVMTHLLNHE